MNWHITDSANLYQVEGWGQGYFRVGSGGGLLVDPNKSGTKGVSLHEIMVGLTDRGFDAPMILRFPDVLRHRLRHLAQAFQEAIRDNEYMGGYSAVYPIKVNQQRHLVEEIYEFGAEFGFGLEVGSKPELLAVMSMTASNPERPIICNGFKDDRYIEAVVLASKLGRNIVPVVESFDELGLIIKYAEKYGVRPQIGVRVKLSSQGVGRWRESSGHRSKFGLFITEVLSMVKVLEEHDMLDCLQLLHCHVGSQIHNIRLIKNVINELGQIYVELVKLGAGMRYLDIGGGLGVDYDGTQRAIDSSMNYSLEEYAADVVSRIGNICNQAGIEHPTIISESGRAMVAQHSVLVFPVLGSNSAESIVWDGDSYAAWAGKNEVPKPMQELYESYTEIAPDNLVQSYHDVAQARDEALDLFALGYLNLEGRSLAERLYWSSCVRIRDLMRREEDPHEELHEIETLLRGTYVCNFSLFQSMPDSWAIEQLFPIMPIHRLDEEPTERAILADVTCDSDGRIDHFISDGEKKEVLEVHELIPGEPYYLAAFLIGAYQETLGDLHNLFGDAHVAHIQIEQDGGWSLNEVVPGDTIREVLQYVQYEPDSMAIKLRRDCEHAVRRQIMTPAESRVLMRFYEDGLRGYTYLEGE
ncbi:MAG: biosynthetic arginine decarboxylase [Planctomycetes bacterium]|nr:biosynthetic arginine decarboxylase [Planctomycetota bacterium]MCP4771840.1 biosynthetic arginine decarboxylase [Planctomycetota bacterium]MCP4861985.1 biosynthetic arginine decarboxylase [Planctomycetota bacterium]